MSFFAEPGSIEARSGVEHTAATPASAAGPLPKRRPPHQAARNAIASHGMLRNGVSTSRSNSRIP
jgi:hypothetical protein